MTAGKLACPHCEMVLAPPAPMAAGTLVTCPRCGRCFGVPALQTKVPRAEVVKGPHVLQAQPVVPAQSAPRAPSAPAPMPASEPRALPPRRRPAAIDPISDALNFADVDVPIPKRADSTQNAKHSKHHRKTKGDPLVLWLMVGSGVLLLAACIAVGAVILSSNKKPASKTPSREVIAPPSAADDKKGGPNEPSRQHEKRGAAGSGAANSQRGKARAADNKDKANGNMAADNNPDGPIPIPGLGPSKSVKP